MVSMGSSGLAPGTYDAKIKLEHDESAVLEVTGRRVGKMKEPEELLEYKNSHAVDHKVNNARRRFSCEDGGVLPLPPVPDSSYTTMPVNDPDPLSSEVLLQQLDEVFKVCSPLHLCLPRSYPASSLPGNPEHRPVPQ